MKKTMTLVACAVFAISTMVAQNDTKAPAKKDEAKKETPAKKMMLKKLTLKKETLKKLTLKKKSQKLTKNNNILNVIVIKKSPLGAFFYWCLRHTSCY